MNIAKQMNSINKYLTVIRMKKKNRKKNLIEFLFIGILIKKWNTVIAYIDVLHVYVGLFFYKNNESESYFIHSRK